MIFEAKHKSEFVVVDTSAFIRNANLQEIGMKCITVPEVVNEIKSKRQLRRLIVLPYDLEIKEAFPESLSHVAEFAKKTGDFPSLSSTDLKVLALTYQLEKEHVGVEHLRTVPKINRSVDYCNYSAITAENIAGFYKPKKGRQSNKSESSEISETEKINNENNLIKSIEQFNIVDDESDYLSAHSDFSDFDEFLESEENINNSIKSIDGSCSKKAGDDEHIEGNFDENVVGNSDDNNDIINNIFVKVSDVQETAGGDKVVEEGTQKEGVKNEEEHYNEDNDYNDEDDYDGDDDVDDDIGWITPSNVKQAKQEMDADNLEEKPVKVACLTTDFAMQNVLKQMGLNVLSLDGRVIKQMRTFILRCYACFKTTSIMTRVFCHHCGNKTLKKVAVSLDAEGNQKIHINLRRPLTARGKKFSLPKPTGGKHSNYPILSEDQPMPDQRPSRLARTKNNPLEPDYIAGFSPFVMRDVNSKSAMLGVMNKGKEMKYWMRRNPNESFGKKKKKK